MGGERQRGQREADGGRRKEGGRGSEVSTPGHVERDEEVCARRVGR